MKKNKNLGKVLKERATMLDNSRVNNLNNLRKHKTLVLDSSYQPIAIIPWERAITLLLAGKGEALDLYSDIKINSVSSSFDLPSVLKVHALNKRKKRINFNRWSVFARDNFKCCYCGKKYSPKELSLDHVIPLSQGGCKSWENIVSSCLPCNQEKGSRTPQEAGLKIHFKPHEPKWSPWFIFRIARSELIEAWKPWLTSKNDEFTLETK